MADLPPHEGSDNGIAIIGMSCRVPGAHSVAELWQNLCQGVESFTRFTRDELRAAGVDAALLEHPDYVPMNRIIDGIADFDAAFFQCTPREAELLDPQQRLFLECAQEALELAGYAAREHRDSVGVYAGSTISSYLLYNLLPNAELARLQGIYPLFLHTDKDFLATRTSYKLDLKGPSVNVQTACSTSLVAVHLACQALLEGECGLALAGGASIRVPQRAGYLYQKDMVFSPDGRCRPFDAEAAGTVAGDGVGVVVLKRLDAALADGDPILAVIRGSALSNDGAGKVGYTAPSIEGQARAIRDALSIAGVSADSISYVETHGTATPLGDPIEIAALTRAFRESTSRQGFCAIGALKANLGHMDAAAGVGGLIKTVLMLQHAQIPPVPGFRSANPRLGLDESPFFVNTRLKEWKAEGTPRRAGVSAFGIGGTNAHVIVEEAPAPARPAPARPWQLLAVSAKSEPALQVACQRLADALAAPASALADVAYTLHVGREPWPFRAAVVCQAPSDAAAALRQKASETAQAADDAAARSLAFLFPGGGAQYPRMGRDLYEQEPSFRQELDRCALHVRDHLVPGFDLRDLILGTAVAEARMRQPLPGLVSLFAVEIALARLLVSWGLMPQVMLGHSLGEYAAACLSGVFALEDALALVARRGALFQSLPACGSMLSVALSAESLQPLLGPELTIAAKNLPGSCTVSGPIAELDRLAVRLAQQGTSCRAVHIDVAAHSPAIDGILPAFRELLRRTRLSPPRIPILSNLTGAFLTAEQATDPEYWVQHLRRTVQFADSLTLLLQDESRLIVEVGPGNALAPLVRQHPGYKGQGVLGTLRHAQDAQPGAPLLLATLGELWSRGASLDWHAFHAHERRQRVPLPTYPFERQRYFIEAMPGIPVAPPAAAPRLPASDWFFCPIWKQSPLVPAADGKVRRFVCFADPQGRCDRLAAQLRRAGHAVVLVRSGARFARLGADEFSVRAEVPADYSDLLHALAAASYRPEVFVHGFLLPAIPDAQIAAAQTLGLYSLLALTQAADQHGVLAGARIAVLTTGVCSVIGEEALAPEKATLLGWLKTMPHEYPDSHAQAIDVPSCEGAASDPDRLMEHLATELQSADEDLVAYRRGRRWVRRFEPLQLGAADRSESLGLLRKNGVYLITGGLGGVGLELASALAERVPARLILVGRTALPPATEGLSELSGPSGLANLADEPSGGAAALRTAEVLRRLRALEERGCQVLPIAADVGDRAAMESVIAVARARFGEIHGVIHAAGVPGGGVMLKQTPARISETLHPKIAGTRVLEAIFGESPLDFLVLCSALVTLPGAFGHIDYTAANAFLDAFAAARSAAARYPVLSLNWSRWQHTGMALAIEAQHQALSGEALDGMSQEEGRAAFLRLIGDRRLCEQGIAQVAVSYQPLSAVLQRSQARTPTGPTQDGEAKRRPRSLHKRPATHTPFIAPSTPAETQLAALMQELLGIEPVGARDHFFELGGNSLVGVRLVARMREEMAPELSLRDLFDAPTPAALALRIEALRTIRALKQPQPAQSQPSTETEEGLL